jgi:hypothetical protein
MAAVSPWKFGCSSRPCPGITRDAPSAGSRSICPESGYPAYLHRNRTAPSIGLSPSGWSVPRNAPSRSIRCGQKKISPPAPLQATATGSSVLSRLVRLPLPAAERPSFNINGWNQFKCGLRLPITRLSLLNLKILCCIFSIRNLKSAIVRARGNCAAAFAKHPVFSDGTGRPHILMRAIDEMAP